MVAKYANVYADVRISIIPDGNVELRFPNATDVNVTSPYSFSFTMPNTESLQWPGSESGALLSIDSSQPIASIVLPGVNSTNFGPEAIQTFGSAYEHLVKWIPDNVGKFKFPK
jgi:hypothetical protein